MLDMLDLATTLFYYSIAGLPGIFTGISMAAGYIAIMCAEFGFGSLSDRTPTRWGRRKPFVAVGAPLMAIAFLFVFSPTWFVAQGDVIGLFIYALITQVIFKITYGMTMTPFQAWMPELTEPVERPSVSSWQNVANFLGFVIGVFGGLFIATEAIQHTIANDWILPTELIMVFLIIIAIQLVGFIAPLTRLKKEGKYIEHPNLKEEIRKALKNRDFVLWMAAQGLLSIGVAMVVKTTFPYINDYLMFSDLEFLVFGVELLTVVFIFFLIWRWMIKYKGKRIALQTAMMLAVFSLPLTLIITQRILNH
jgi:GPH family glycoside/pentoside/hexuronide:cation symporter